MADSYLWTIDHGIVQTKDYPHKYKASKPGKCDKVASSATRFYNKNSNEEDNASNDFLKSVLAH